MDKARSSDEAEETSSEISGKCKAEREARTPALSLLEGCGSFRPANEDISGGPFSFSTLLQSLLQQWQGWGSSGAEATDSVETTDTQTSTLFRPSRSTVHTRGRKDVGVRQQLPGHRGNLCHKKMQRERTSSLKFWR